MVDLQRQIVEVSLALDYLSSICMLTSHNFVLCEWRKSNKFF